VPTLEQAALDKQIALRRLGPLYLWVGDDARLVARLVDDLEATVDPADRPFAVERMYAGDPGGLPVDIAAAARSFPMLGDRRIVIVLRAERFLKPRRAGRGAEAVDADSAAGPEEPADLGPLEDYVQAPLASTTLVFVASDVDRSRRFTKRLVDKAQVTAFGLSFGPRPDRRDVRSAAEKVVSGEVAAAGRTIDPRAVQVLVDRAGDDVSRLRGDLERLLLYTEGRTRITYDDALEVAAGDAPVEDDWAVVNAIAAGNAAQALRETGRRLDRGDSPYALVGQLRWWVSARLAEGDPDRVRQAVDALLRTDLALKRSGDPRVLLERLVVELTGRPLPAKGWGGRR
jgi:DNA polymerase III delta subunit